MCMERRKDWDIEDLKKRIDDLENTVIVISRLLLDKEVYDVDDIVKTYNEVKKCNDSNDPGKIVIDGGVLEVNE